MYIFTLLILVYHILDCTRSDHLHTDPLDSQIWIRYSKPINVSCTITRNRKTNITWLKDGQPAANNKDLKLTTEIFYIGTDITTKLTLYTKHSDFSDSGNYTCTDGKVSKSMQVDVIKGKIKIRPSNDRVVTFVKDTISLFCEYEGNEKLDIYWLKNDITPVKDLSFISNERTITGVKITKTSEITKLDLKSSDSGDYYCHAGPFSKKITVEVYPGQCNFSLITGNHGVADDHITASSYYEDLLYSDAPNRARLNNVRETRQTDDTTKYYGGAWAPKVNDNKQWIMVKLQKLSVIRKIVTQGRSSTDCCNQEHWVTSFKFSYSQDNVTWYKYKDATGSAMIFTGNYDHNTFRLNALPVPVVAQYVHINPVSWNQRIAMRFDVIGCFLPSDIRITEPRSGALSLEIPSSLYLSCQFVGPDRSAVVTWFKDGRDISENTEFNRKSITTDIDGQTKTILSIRKLVTNYSDSGHYMCMENKTGLNSSTAVHIANLEMYPSTGEYWAVSSQPLNITCVYKGAELQDVNWSYNGEIPVFRKSLETRSNEDGVHSISRIFKPRADMSDGGNYSCSVGDFKKTLELRVITVTKSVSSNIISAGKSVTFRCGLFGVPDDMKFDVFWSKEQKPINSIQSLNGRYDYYPHTKTFVIHKTKLSDAGKYECNVILNTNSANKQHLFVNTELYATPDAKIEGQKTLKSGDSLHLYCKTTGYPKPQIVWYKGPKELTEKTSRITFLPYSGSNNGHLVVFDVSLDDANEYSCEGVANGFPPIKSSMVVEVNESENGNNILLIIVIVICSTSLIVVIVCVACCFRCKRRRSKRKSPDTLESLARARPQITKTYVDMGTTNRQKCSVSEEEIHMLPPPPPPDLSSLRTFRSSEDGSETYETFRQSGEHTTVKESLNI